MRTVMRYAMILGAAGVVGLAGCGRGSDAPSAPSSVDAQKVAQYRQCMRSAGVDVPDPGPGNEPAVVALSTSDPGNLAALSACARFAPPVDAQDAPSDAEQERALKLAECLRGQGIDAKDPDAGSTIVSLADGATYSHEKLTTAYSVCNQQVPAVPDGGE
ncbi:hypothetical protein AB0J80_27435 [Actinoplanes sp. NPDC049548]|uniref:hypothetical protein n=1 Tax=Actinoplanes sp. NPDC049548 TaxID=3155152 RepID=UPI0034452B02